MNAEDKKEYWGAHVDGVRLAMGFQSKFWVLLAAVLGGALLTGGIYLAWRHQAMGQPAYRAERLYFIRYDIQEEDEVLKAFINEYNAYTWGEMMRSDKVIPLVMRQLPDVERSLLESCLETAIATDPEFLTVGYITDQPALSERIADAFDEALVSFGATLRERGLADIEVWKRTSAQVVEVENRVLNALALGTIAGLVLGAFGLWFWCVLDDTLLTLQETQERCGHPVLGFGTKGGASRWDRRLEQALATERYRSCRKVRCEEALGTVLPVIEAVEKGEKKQRDREADGKGGVLLYARWGVCTSRQLNLAICELRNQGQEVSGVILEDAKESFLNRYYGIKALHDRYGVKEREGGQ